MTAAELADRIISEPAQARRILATGDPIEGLSQEFCARVLHLYGADHGTLLRLRPAARAVIAQGDEPALGYRCLAIIDLVRGKWLASADSFLKAGEHARNEFDRYSLQRGAVQALYRSGRVEQALEVGQRLIDGLLSQNEDGSAAQVALNMGNALNGQARYEEALELLQGLPERLLQAGFPADAAAARVALTNALLFSGKVNEARAAAELARQEAEAIGFELAMGAAQRGVALADLLRGDPDLAVSSLLQLRSRQTDSPVELAETLEYLGDAFGAMNLWIESADAYRESLALGQFLSPLHHAHLHLGLGQTLLASGQPREALLELAKASRRYRALRNLVWYAAAETDRAIAERELGKRGVRRRVEGAIEIARQSGTPYPLARALLASAAAGGPDSHLDEAATILEAYPFPRLNWRVHVERAKRSVGNARLEHHRHAFSAILEEQARLSSFASRIGYLRDKADALRSYLEDLLSDPSEENVAEAISVVSRSRAVALLDELLHARTTGLPSETSERLRQLRLELNEQGDDGPSQGTRRRSGATTRLDRVQRQWIEETHAIERAATLEHLRPAEDSVVLVEAARGHRGLSRSNVVHLPNTETLSARLEWLSYDLLTPMLNRDADPKPAMQGLREIGESVVRPLLTEQPRIGVCPEGPLWRVPWLACLDALNEERDLELRMHPGLMGKDPDLRAKPAMLWVAEHADLPWVHSEAEMFLSHFPNAQVCRSADEVRCCMSSSDVSVLHVISHARHRWRHPMFSSLDFTDGPVLAAEIGRSGLRAELVTLSGCDTGRVSDTNRLEPDGLVRAFLACGAGYVVGSAWPLDDEAAVHLYQSFYNSISKDLNVHVSLRKARQRVQNWKEHPYFWASPLLYGGYRK